MFIAFMHSQKAISNGYPRRCFAYFWNSGWKILLRQIIFVRWGFGVCLAVPLIFNLQFWEVFSLSTTFKATATVDRKSGHRLIDFFFFLVFIKRSSCISLSNMGLEEGFSFENCTSSDYIDRGA